MMESATALPEGDPAAAEFHNNASAVLAELGRWGEALEYAERAVACNADFAPEKKRGRESLNCKTMTPDPLSARVIEYKDDNVLAGNFNVEGTGTGNGGGTFSGTSITPVHIPTTLKATIAGTVTSDTKIEETIGSGTLTIAWKIKRTINVGTTAKVSEKDYSSTKNSIYITGTAAPDKFHTLLEIACGGAVSGKRPGNPGEAPNLAAVEEQAVVTAVWSKFKGRAVRRVDDHLLTYWANGAANATNTAELLHDGNGQCGSWAEFFVDALSVHGIVGKKRTVTSIYGANSAFLVKNWDFVGAGTSGDVQFPYLMQEVTDKRGAAGQGNKNPPGGFYNHFIVSYNGQFYDPSYGNDPYASHADWEDASLAGFTKELPNGSTFVKKNSLGANNIETVLSP